MQKIIKKLYKNNELEYDELLYLLNNIDLDTRKLLFSYAEETKIKSYGKSIFLRGLVEFSNYCKCTCKYCGLRRMNKKIKRYRLNLEEILDCCKIGNNLGFKTVVLQSGEDAYYTDELLESIIKNIKKEFTNIAVTLSIGERSYESYEKLYKAGADRYLLRHETATKNLYTKLHPQMSFQNRRKCLSNLRDIGYQVGAGFIVGLPKASNEDTVKNLLYLKKLKPHMVGIGPLVIHPDTPLRNYKNGTTEDTLICLALTRLLLPEVLLPATTALANIDNKGLQKGLKAGANVIMPNLTPSFAREKYEIYRGKSNVSDEATEYMEQIKYIVGQAGHQIDMSRGDHKRWNR